MNNLDKRISHTISASRFPLALFVIFIHSIGNSNAHWYAVRHFLSIDILSFVVPTFFIFSGYLFSWDITGKEKNWYKSKLLKRVKTLFIPYCLWNIVALLLDYIKYLKGSESWIDFSNYDVYQIIQITFINYKPLNLPLWYIRDLMILIIISPIIIRLIKKSSVFTLVIIGIWYFLNLGPFIISPKSMLFFSIGIFLGIEHLNLLIDKVKFMIFTSVVLLSIIVYGVTDIRLALNCYRLFMPFVFIFIISVLINHNESCKTTLMKLSKYSKILYYSHYPITLILAIKIVSWVMPIYTMLNYIVTPVLAAMLSIVLQMVLDKLLDKKKSKRPKLTYCPCR